MNESALFKEAAEVLTNTRHLVLACHVGPDGDALGSMLGLGLAARNAGKTVTTSFGSPFTVPENLRFLPVDILVAPGEVPTQPETMVVLDVGSPDRLGELAENASKAGKLIVLDHHITNEGFGDISIVDGKAAATGEMVFDLLEILEWEITAEIANCLHTAVVTDTGRFTYANTTAKTLRVASELVSLGANTTEIGRHVYEEAPFGYLKAAAAALARAQIDLDLGVVSTFVTHEDLSAAGVDWDNIDGLIDTIRLAEEADVAVLAKVYDDGRVKVSMRSRGDTDVGGLAFAMGGGGHRLAAGFTTDGTAEETIAEVLAQIEDYR